MPITINPGMLGTIRDDPDEQWDDQTITFSIGVDPGNIISDILDLLGISDFDPDETGFGGDAEIAKMVEVAELWDDLIARNISYVYNNDDEDIIVNKVTNMPAGAGGVTLSTLHTIFPDDADVFLVDSPLTPGMISWRAAVHEFGHALGLQHPGDYDADEGPTTYANNRSYDEDTGQFSIMSYFEPSNYGAGWVAGVNTWSRTEILTPMIYDILAIQAYYGVDTTTRTGDTTYGFGNNSGRSVFDFNTTRAPVFTIWDAGGANDELNASQYTAAQFIDLHEGSYSDVGGLLRNIGIAFGTWIERAIGGGGGDTLIGNHLNNYLDGGAGVDTLRGELGDDTYVVDVAGDVVVELANEGTDTVNSFAASFTLSDNVEKLIYVGDANVGFTGTGNALNNEIRGAANAANTLDGKAGDDIMVGGAKNDLYVVDSYGDQTVEAAGGGNDTVRTALGNYTLQANVENLEFTGVGPLVTAGNDLDNTITGNIGNDVVSGAGGNDTLTGNSGHDTLSGDAGDDRVYGGVGNDLLDGGADNDIVDGGTGDDQIGGGTGNDTLTGGANNDYVDGNDGNDTVSGDEGNDQVSGGAGNDFVYGGSGNDLVDGGADNDTVTGDAGDDQVGGGSGDDNVSGGANNDYVDGGDGDDTVNGDAGDDQVTGDAGNDTVSGGANNDYVDGGDGNDTVNGDEGNDQLSGGAGNDMMSGGSGTDNMDGGDGEDSLDGGTEADVLSGGAGNDTLAGGSGNDTVSGGDGDDTIREGAGADTIDGGAGIDKVDYSASTVGISFSLLGYGTYGDAAGDKLQNIEILIGTAFADILVLDTADNMLYGLAGNDQLFGLAGNDWLDGGTGSDAMTGGSGDDVYIVDDTKDTTIEAANQGRDRVETVLTYYTLSSNVEDLTYTGTSNFTGIGNTLANRIIGAGGNDILKGDAGDDVLDGKAGADTMYGGRDNDTYYVDVAGDKVVENKSEGTDTVFSQVSYALAANVENLTLLAGSDATGNELVNILTGNAGNNRLDGGAGADTLIGLAGDDTYIVDNSGDRVIEAANEGDDLVQSSVSFMLAAGQAIERLTLTGTGNIDGTGNEFANSITGNNGKNVLDGKAGADNLVGLGGDDTYVVDDAGDQVTEAANGGTDVVKSSVSYTLGVNLEALVLTGSAAINATGNTAVNGLYGNAAANVLDGGAGADWLQGEGGDDTYVVDNTGDRVCEFGNGGIDTVQSSITWSLGDNVEKLTLTGTGNINGTGNSLANTLVGNAGANILDGNSGNDILTGGLGQDIFLFDTSLSATTNVDTITDFSVVDDTIKLENAVFTSLGSAGALSAAAFCIGATALDSSDRIVYNSVTGALSYDSNGSSSGGFTQFAKLQSGLALTAADFMIV